MKIKLNKIIAIVGIITFFALNSLNAEVTNIIYDNNKESSEVVLNLRTTNATKKISLLSAVVGNIEIDIDKNIKWQDFSDYGVTNYIFL